MHANLIVTAPGQPHILAVDDPRVLELARPLSLRRVFRGQYAWRARAATIALPLCHPARPVARPDQSLRDGPGVRDAAVADPAAGLRLRHPQGLRRAPRARTA